MRKMVLVILVLLITGMGFAEKVATLHEVMKSGSLAVDDNQLYVVDDATIHIFSLKDYKFIKKFGKRGEGPAEFMPNPSIAVTIDVSTDELIVFSFGKLSFFTKEGELKNELKLQGFAFFLKPIGNQFLGMSRVMEGGRAYNTVNIYDSKLNKLQEIYKVVTGWKGRGKGMAVLTPPFLFEAYDNKIFLSGSVDGTIDVFDAGMKKLYSINVDVEKVKLTQDFKNRLLQFFKTSPETKGAYEALFKPIQYPEYYPSIQRLFCADKKLYVLTWKTGEGNRYECFIYDMNGKFLKKVGLPVSFQTEIQLYPATIRNEKLYQLVENIDEEEWDLYVDEIK